MARDSENTSVLHNVIAQGTEINGNIKTNSDIRIDGTLEGNLVCQGKVVIGPQGSVKGDIECNSADFHGIVEGHINTYDTLSIKATAKVTGELRTKVLSIEPNALFNGTCEMTGRE